MGGEGRVHDVGTLSVTIDPVTRHVIAFSADGKFVDQLPQSESAHVINADGLVVMPGGIDMHCHVGSATVNHARILHNQDHCLCPDTFQTGLSYAAMGYTTVIDAAVSPSGARHAHMELDDTPCVDAGFLLMLANNEHLIELLGTGDRAGVTAVAAHMLRKTGAFGIKAVNPGGVAAWRRDPAQHTIETIDDTIADTSVTPRAILEALADAAEELQLPHPLHVHCNRLGMSNNVDTTLDTLKALDGRRVHLAHLQFHAYGQNDKGRFASAADRLVAYLNDHPNVTADVGQIVFGNALTITSDTPLVDRLAKLTGSDYLSVESECEAGVSIMPHTFAQSGYTRSLQWAIGLELLLSVADPWQILLSIDQPNGGSFLSYPGIIAALMSKDVRSGMIDAANPKAMRWTKLASLSRQMTLAEIAIITRTGPARALGLSQKGHLGPGADADVTIYNDNAADPQRMFESPRYVIKAGHVLVDDGQMQASIQGARLRASIEPNDRGEQLTRDWFARHGSYDISQFGMHEHELQAMHAVAEA